MRFVIYNYMLESQSVVKTIGLGLVDELRKTVPFWLLVCDVSCWGASATVLRRRRSDQHILCNIMTNWAIVPLAGRNL